MLRVCEDAFYFAVCRRVPEENNKTLLYVLEMFQANHIPFHGMSEYSISREMYDPHLPKWPLKVKFSYTGQHGPFTQYQIQMFTADTNKLLMTRTLNVSFVNLRTRKLDDLPQWYTKGLAGKECFKTNVHVERLIKPENTYQQAMTVSDAILKCLLKEKRKCFIKHVTSGSTKFYETVSCGDVIEKNTSDLTWHLI